MVPGWCPFLFDNITQRNHHRDSDEVDPLSTKGACNKRNHYCRNATKNELPLYQRIIRRLRVHSVPIASHLPRRKDPAQNEHDYIKHFLPRSKRRANVWEGFGVALSSGFIPAPCNLLEPSLSVNWLTPGLPIMHKLYPQQRQKPRRSARLATSATPGSFCLPSPRCG